MPNEFNCYHSFQEHPKCQSKIWHNIVESLDALYGKHRWFGGEAIVWRANKHVFKLIIVGPNAWKRMRVLQRRDGPFAKIIDMRVIGKKITAGEIKILGLISQEYIPQARSSIKAPRLWSDDVDNWEQFDDNAFNASNGMWVDLTSILSFQKIPRKENDARRKIRYEKLYRFY